MLKTALVISLFSLAAPCFAQQQAQPQRPWMNQSLTPDRRADLVIAQMMLDEKIQLVHGAGLAGFGPSSPALARSNGGGGFVPGIERLGLPDLNMDDSAVGVGSGASKGRYSTALPSTLGLASSWDLNLAHEYGTIIGSELGDQGYNVSLAGGVDITREPRNGRNFEYMGEDPILAGNTDAELIEGIQSQGIIGDVKHYVVNDEETGRFFSNSVIGKRALREGDMLAFQIAVEKAHPGMVMCSYNQINGTFGCENSYTLTDVLKKEWGFQGWVISDWFATHSTEKAVMAGLDQEQPGFVYLGDTLKSAVGAGQVPVARLNEMVHRILRTEFAIGIIDHPRATGVPDIFHGFDVAQRVEEQSAVLLKNADHLLPLDAANVRSIAIIGAHADTGVLSGGGSAQVDPPGAKTRPPSMDPHDLLEIFTRVVWDPSSPMKAIEAHAHHAHVAFDDGSDVESAARLAHSSDVAIVFVHQHMHEGSDAETLQLPNNQNDLVEKVAAANRRTIVVLETGGPVAMPWIDHVGAALEAWYPGIRGAEAIANLLFGEANPSGKLAVSFAKSDADLPHPKLPVPAGPLPTPLDGIMVPKPIFDVDYSEGLKVGYKWFDAENKTPLFPFGYGLSYTTFAYSDLHAELRKGLHVTFKVKNTGDRQGAEVAQVYVALPSSAGEPPKRLVGWQKVPLAVGETTTVTVDAEPLYLSTFDTDSNQWKVPDGEYQVLAGASSRDIRLKTNVK